MHFSSISSLVTCTTIILASTVRGLPSSSKSLLPRQDQEGLQQDNVNPTVEVPLHSVLFGLGVGGGFHLLDHYLSRPPQQRPTSPKSDPQPDHAPESGGRGTGPVIGFDSVSHMKIQLNSAEEGDAAVECLRRQVSAMHDRVRG